LLGGTRELRKVFFDNIPVKVVGEQTDFQFKMLIDKYIEFKNDAKKCAQIEKEINEYIYKIYSISSSEEITINNLTHF